MTTGRELLQSRTYTGDRLGTRSASRVWLVDVQSEASAIQYVVNAGAGYLAPYPGDAGLIVDSISARPISDGTYEVTASYSNAKLFTFENQRKENTATVTYTRLSFSLRDTETAIPYAIQLTRKAPRVGAEPERTFTVWELREQTITETSPVIQLEVRLPKLTLAQVQAIANQSNVLHQLAGRWYKFKCGGIRADNDTEDLVYYEWEGDNGTKPLTQTPVGTAPANGYPSTSTIIFPNLTRTPWYKIVGIPKSTFTGTVQDPPTWASVLQFDFNQTGYNSLPWPASGKPSWLLP